jgi:hypothetical protein
MCPPKNLEVIHKINTYWISIYKINRPYFTQGGHIRATSAEFTKMTSAITDEVGDITQKKINMLEPILSKRGQFMTGEVNIHIHKPTT